MSPRSYQQLVRLMNRVIEDAELTIKIARDQVDKPSSKSKMRKATEKDIFPGATLILKTADLGGNERMVYVFPTGWWNPEPWRSTSKWHWVTVTGRTLCGRYAYIRGDLEQGNDDSGDNCSACRKKRQKANAKGQR